jgi:hypothetical protein
MSEDDLFKDWLRHPETDRIRKVAVHKVEQGMKLLLSQARMSTDSKVAAIANSITAFQAVVVELSPKQEKPQDDDEPGEDT